MPERQRVGRLHVVMAVEQDMRRVRAGFVVLGDHAGQAGGFRQPGGKTHLLQGGYGPVGGGVTVRAMRRLGADTGDAQQLEQPSE